MLDHAIEFVMMIPPRKQSQTAGRAAVCFCLNYIVPVKLGWLFSRQ
jgi:hypothetical protein